YAEVRAPARTLAKMALTVGITPEQMASEGQRPDAAEAMRHTPAAAIADPAADSEEAEHGIVVWAEALGINPSDPADPWLLSVRQDIADATMRYGAGAAGAQIFRGEAWSRSEAEVWDNGQLNRKTKELLIASTRANRAQYEAGRSGINRSTGLASVATLARR